VQAHDVALRQQVVQLAHLARVAQRQLGDHVEESHLHAERLGQYRQLRADRAVAHDAQRLAADLEGVLGRFEPAAAVRHRALLGHAAQQQDGFGEHQLRNRTGIGIGRVEDHDAVLARRVQIDLVGADAEGAGGNQLVRGGKDFRRQLRARADAQEVHVGNAGLELGLRQRAGKRLDVRIARGPQHFDGRGMDAFEQKELDLALVEGGLAHGSPGHGPEKRRAMLAWCNAASGPAGHAPEKGFPLW
jgi:hypothetical protein